MESSFHPEASAPLDPRRDVRTALDHALPAFVQPLFTYLTGLAPDGTVLSKRRQATVILAAFAVHYAGLVLGMTAGAVGAVAAIGLLPFAWTLSVAGARDLQLTIFHHCAHGTVISPTVSLWLGRLIGTILVIQPFDSYAPKHRREHHGRQTVSTLEDPTVLFLLNEVGIIPGDSNAANRRRILWALISPVMHLRMLGRRLADQFGSSAGWENRLATGLYLILLLGGGASVAGWQAVVFGILAPMTCGYQAAQILRLVVEHRWPAANSPDTPRDMPRHDQLTVSNRSAVAPPAEWTPASTTRFAAATLVNSWVRFTILPGDSGPSHSWHHGEARGDWANHVSAAAAWAERRQAKGGHALTEAWGIGEAFRLSLESFALASMESLEGPHLKRTRRNS